MDRRFAPLLLSVSLACSQSEAPEPNAGPVQTNPIERISNDMRRFLKDAEHANPNTLKYCDAKRDAWCFSTGLPSAFDWKVAGELTQDTHPRPNYTVQIAVEGGDTFYTRDGIAYTQLSGVLTKEYQKLHDVTQLNSN